MPSALNHKNKIRKMILVFAAVCVFFASLIFFSRVDTIVKNGTIDLSEAENETVYLFGQWSMIETHADPKSTLFDDASIYTINTNALPSDIGHYSLQATIKNLNTENYCLLLENVNYVDRIYINDSLVYDVTDPSYKSNGCITLDDLSSNAPFTITLWMTGGTGRQGMLNPLTLLLTHTDNAYSMSNVRIVIKYILEGVYLAFALICLMMYLKNKASVHFLFLSLSGLIRMCALESYLAPSILFDWLNIPAALSLQISMLFIAIASTLNVAVIYTLYKQFIYKKITFALIIGVNACLLLTLISGNATFAGLLNIAGYGLYLVCLVAVGRAWLSGGKSAGYMFTAFLIYMISMLFFYGTRMLAGMGSTLGVYNFICPIGEFLFYAVTIVAFFVRYIESYVQNVSQIQTLDTKLSDKERSLSEAYNKLSQFETARTRMLRDFSHDLRTPVTSVLGYLSMMASGEISDEKDVKDISGKMLMRVRQIRDMTNSLSSLATLEQGELKMHMEPYSVSDIIKDVELHYGQKCKDAGLNFSTQQNSDKSVLADMPQVMRVFDNLINNAIRYTPENGRITISAEDSGEMVRFSVKDTGCGIPKDQQDQVFDRFYIGEKSRSQSGEHQGLGLAICYEIIKAHNGTIGVISINNKGSEFYFTLHRAIEGERA